MLYNANYPIQEEILRSIGSKLLVKLQVSDIILSEKGIYIHINPNTQGRDLIKINKENNGTYSIDIWLGELKTTGVNISLPNLRKALGRMLNESSRKHRKHRNSGRRLH